MKTVITMIIATASLWALTATVKNGEVTVKIGNTTKTYQKGATFPVAYNEKICLSPNSKGIIKLDEEQGQITVDACVTPKKLVRTAPEPSILAKVFTLFKKTNETSKDGVGVKGSDDEKYTEDILLSDLEGKEYLNISNENWATPLTLKVMDRKKEVYSANIEGESEVKFLVPVEKLKSGMKIKVENSFFEESMMDSLVKQERR